MPHIIVEHSDLKFDVVPFLLFINKTLCEKFPEEFPAPAAIKTRAVNVGNDYCIGINLEEQPTVKFIHTNIRILSGRPLEVRRAISEAVYTALQSYLQTNLDFKGLHVQCTVECGELVKETFFKHVFDGRTE